MNEQHCQLDSEGRCITCSDEALTARVVHIDATTGVALVEMQDATEEVDITLIEGIAPGDLVLLHGGVAIGRAVSDG